MHGMVPGVTQLEDQALGQLALHVHIPADRVWIPRVRIEEGHVPAEEGRKAERRSGGLLEACGIRIVERRSRPQSARGSSSKNRARLAESGLIQAGSADRENEHSG